MVGTVGNPYAAKVDVCWRKTATETFHMIQKAYSEESHVYISMNQDIIFPTEMRCL